MPNISGLFQSDAAIVCACSPLGFFSFVRRCCWDPSISRKETNDQTVSSISHLYLGEVPSDAVDYHTRSGAFYWTNRSLSQTSRGPYLYLKNDIDKNEEKGCGGVVAGALLRLL